MRCENFIVQIKKSVISYFAYFNNNKITVHRFFNTFILLKNDFYLKFNFVLKIVIFLIRFENSRMRN